ncbi:MAG: Gldg family protein [Planctomycetota bacterium]
MSAERIPTAHPPRRVLRFNAILTAVLVLAIVVLGNVLAERHLRVRSDVSADGLQSLSDATRRIVGRVEDRLSVRLYANEEVRDGGLALRNARVRAQLDELLALRRAAFDLQVLDPSRSSEARRRALESGLRPTRGVSSALGRGGGEEVWLGLVLGYRGRTEVIARPEPWGFEVQFASALHSLLSDRKVGIAWAGAPFAPPVDVESPDIANSFSTFNVIRSALEQRGRLIQLPPLEYGRPVPDDVDVLFLVRPTRLHERAVYEIDQFVQRGGRLVVCLDDPDYNLLIPTANRSQDDFRVTPLGKLMESWGIRVANVHVWDEARKSPRLVFRVSPGGGPPEKGQVVDPLVLTVPPEGLERSLPPTRGLPSVQFGWAHPLYAAEDFPPPASVERTDLAWSSDDARVADVAPSVARDPAAIRVRGTALRTQKGRRHVLATVLGGRFPSPWEGADPPAPFVPPGFEERELDEPPPRSREVASQVVIFGDADWLRDPFGGGTFVQGGGGVLAINLVDWLTLDEDLIGLRSRAPRLRPLRDFVLEEERALGLFREDTFQTETERIEASRRSDLARRRAQRKQWLTMLAPAAGALLVVALFGLFWNGMSRRRARDEEAAR